MQLSPQSIEGLCLGARPLIDPFIPRTVHEKTGLSGGLSCAGYDVHMGDTIMVSKADDDETKLFLGGTLHTVQHGTFDISPRTGILAVTAEKFALPDDICMYYFNKSTLARKFINAAATLGEPGWEGHLTLEIYNQTDRHITLHRGQPIGQVVFHRLDVPSATPYRGKYQGQGAVPVAAKREEQ